MKIHHLEAHDRYLHFLKQGEEMGKTCQEIIDEAPFGKVPFYIFAHKRTLPIDERLKHFLTGKYANFEDVPTHKYVWQPRLFRPVPESNSILIKAYPPSDKIKVCWIIPEEEIWFYFGNGFMIDNNFISECIYKFVNEKEKLAAKEEDDVSEEKGKKIYESLSEEAKRKLAISCQALEALEASSKSDPSKLVPILEGS